MPSSVIECRHLIIGERCITGIQIDREAVSALLLVGVVKATAGGTALRQTLATI